MKFDTSELYNICSSFSGNLCSLFEIATWKNGLPFKKINISDSGIPIIKIAELKNGISGTTSYTNQIFGEEVHLHKGDLLFSWSGNPETSIDIFEFELEEGWLNQHIFKITPDEKKVDRDYFYFMMKYLKPRFVQIATNKQTTGLGHVTVADIKRITITLPCIEFQKKLVSYLKPLDDKIRLNMKINENLEQQAQTLYSAWFENFIPFGGEIPPNWSAGCLGDIAKISTASFNPAKNHGVMLEHYSIPAFDEKKFPVFETSDNIKSNKYTLSSSSVLASRLNPETKRIWRPLCISSNAVCSTEFIVFNALNPLMKDFVYTIIDSASFSKWMCSHTTGSTNSRQRTAHTKTLEFKISIPSEDVIKDFCSTVTPMYDLIAENSMEIQRLSKLRDTLLPKLMSGEIDVSNISL